MFWGFARTTPEARVRFMRVTMWCSIVMGSLYLVAAILGYVGDRGPRDARQAAFASWCQAEQQGDCAALVDANHDDCYGISGGGMSGGKAGTKPAFDSERYHRCLVVGIDAWRVERAAEVKQEKAKRARDSAELFR